MTFGAGGSGNGEKHLAIARRLKEHYGVLPMAHLPCIHYTKEQIDNILKQFQENGIENVLALRGDRVEGMEPAMDFVHAADLISYIRSFGGFDIAGACYPECHPEAPNMDTDIRHLKERSMPVQATSSPSCFSTTIPSTTSGIGQPVLVSMCPLKPASCR